MKEEVSAHRERRQARVLSRAEPRCLSRPGSRGRVQAVAGWTDAPAGVRGGRHTGPSGQRSLLRVRQGPSPGMSQILPSLEAVGLTAFFPW